MTTSEPAGAGSWWHRPFSVFQTNLQEIDARLDVDATLDFIEDHGADTWLLNTGGIVSFYPTDLPFQSASPHLRERPSGDLVGEAVSAAHERGIKVIARLDLSKVSSRIAGEHPDWLYRSSDGHPQIYNTLYSVCPSGDYYQHRSFDVLDEILDRYAVDGFFFNWFNFNERDYGRRYVGVCHCDSCRELFAARGGQLPSGPESEGYWDWLRFSFETTAALTRRIADHITTRRPDVGLVLRRGASIAYQEASNSFGTDVWHHETAEAVSAHVNGSPGVPVMVNSVSFVDMPYRMAGEQPERFGHYLVQTIARGGNPSTYIMGAPGRIPYANLALGREVTRFHRRHAALYERLRPGAEIAVVRPNRFGMRPPIYARTVEEYRGIFSSLQQTHHPFDVLAVEALEEMGRKGLLRRFSLIILPDLGPLGPGVASALDAFVEGGGHVLATGTSGVAEDGSVELDSSPARMRVDQAEEDAELWSTYATMVDQPDIDDYRYAPPVVPVYGSHSRFVWKPGVTKLGSILPQAPFGPPEKCYGHTRSEHPAMATRRHADGGGVTVVPWTIGRTYRELGTTEVRSVLGDAVTALVQPCAIADLPEQVEVIFGFDDEGTVVHLLNLSGARHRTFGPHVTITGGRLRLHGVRGARAEALVAERSVPLRQDGDDAVLDLPPLELFEVIRIDDSGSETRTEEVRSV